MAESLETAVAGLRSMLLDPAGLERAIGAGRTRHGVPAWQRVELRPVDLKVGRRLQVVGFDGRQAHTSNVEYGAPAAAVVDRLLAEPYGSWRVEADGQTVQLRVTKKGTAQVHRSASAEPSGEADRDTRDGGREHDRAKRRLVEPAEPFLRELGISDADGKLKPSRRDKYVQVEEFVRALAATVGDGAASLDGDAARIGTGIGRPLEVVDLACGNAYLTFAAFRFLSTDSRLGGRPVRVTGVDVKAQAVEHGRAVAAALEWSDAVRFVEGTAVDVVLPEPTDIVLALHACDTATDEALARAVRAAAPVILASPCCHHDIQRQLAAGHERWTAGDRMLVRQPILRERFADVLTDALRAGLLRLLGYRVDVVEFVGSQHTPRNTLIRAVRTGAAPTADQIAEYVELTDAWGVVPRLAQLLAPELSGLLPDS